ncbi:MAG: hypothetical protein CMH64_01705 [Nanoarchaeota archaeon]|nr:hypothetical protein [Nanoarchaeota archaeon]
MMFQVSYERFLEEVRIENIHEGSKDKLELEDLGNMFVYYLVCFDRRKVFVFVIEKSQISAVQKIQLNPISKPARRIIDNQELRQIVQTLERIENKIENESEEI